MSGGLGHDKPPPAPTTSGTLGYPRLHLRRTDSTNERTRALAAAGAPSGTVVTATEQTAGRGRQGRTWFAPAGSSLLLSLLLREPPRLLSLIAAVAVCDAAGDSAAVKWPNDVVIRRAPLAKLAGILVEGRPQEAWAVVGIGVNVAVRLDDMPPELRATAASLGLLSSEIEPFLMKLLGALRRRLAEPSHVVLEAWRARDALLGGQVSWDGGQGRAEGIDEHGHLLVRRSGEAVQTLNAGEVHLRAAVQDLSR